MTNFFRSIISDTRLCLHSLKGNFLHQFGYSYYLSSQSIVAATGTNVRCFDVYLLCLIIVRQKNCLSVTFIRLFPSFPFYFTVFLHACRTRREQSKHTTRTTNMSSAMREKLLHPMVSDAATSVEQKHSKVTVVGVGAVGMACAFSIMVQVCFSVDKL